MQEAMKKRAVELLESGQVNRVLGWTAGEFCYDVTPAVFNRVEDINNGLIYTPFCGANLSKYLVKETLKDGKILVFLKPCDTYSFNQLLSEHRVDREKVYAIGVPCDGMADVERLRDNKITGIKSIARERQINNHLLAFFIIDLMERQTVEVLSLVFGYLRTVHGQLLCKIAITIQQANCYHIYIAIRSLLQIVASQNSQTSGIDFHKMI